MNYSNLYDYFLGPVNIEVWPTEGADPITIEASAFFAWLDVKCYVYESDSYGAVALYQDVDGVVIWESWAEWWADPRVISKPGEFTSTTNLLDALLCEYLNDPANPRFSDCRTVDQLPTEFLTAAEKVAKQTEQ